MLKTAIEMAGFVVVMVHITEIRRTQFDAEAFLRTHDPRVVVYDVPPPFDRSWRFMEHVRTSPGFEGRHFVLTTVNARAVHDIVKTDEQVYEVVGTAGDIDAVVQAVKEASKARPTR